MATGPSQKRRSHCNKAAGKRESRTTRLQRVPAIAGRAKPRALGLRARGDGFFIVPQAV
jgi:hypothetical protein